MIRGENENFGVAEEAQQISVEIMIQRKFLLIASGIGSGPHIADAFLHHAQAELILRPGPADGHQNRQQREQDRFFWHWPSRPISLDPAGRNRLVPTLEL